MSDIKITVCTGAVLNLHVGADAPRVTTCNVDAPSLVADGLADGLADFAARAATKIPEPYKAEARDADPTHEFILRLKGEHPPRLHNHDPEHTYLTLDLIFSGNEVIARAADGSAAERAWAVLQPSISLMVDAEHVTLDRLAGLAEVYAAEIRAFGFGAVLVSSDEGSRHVDLLE